MNFSERYINNNEQEVQHPEWVLLKAQIFHLVQKVKDLLNTGDKEVAIYVSYLINKDVLSVQKEKVDYLIQKLGEESEELINSESANTPEVLKEREQIKNAINNLLEVDELLEEEFKQQEFLRKSTQFISTEKQKAALKIIETFKKEFQTIIHPPAELN